MRVGRLPGAVEHVAIVHSLIHRDQKTRVPSPVQINAILREEHDTGARTMPRRNRLRAE